MKEEDNKDKAARDGQIDKPAPIPTPHFSFGARRFGQGQHRRLFVPQESSSNLTFLQTLERPQALMRVISPSL